MFIDAQTFEDLVTLKGLEYTGVSHEPGVFTPSSENPNIDHTYIEDVNDIDNPWIQGLSTSLGTEHDISYSRRNNYFVVYAAVDLINFMYTKEFYDETKRVVSVQVV